LGEYWLYSQDHPSIFFCDNETNDRRLHSDESAAGFFKDAFHELIVNGRTGAINPHQTGTKAAAHYVINVDAGGSADVVLRLCKNAVENPFGEADAIFQGRIAEAEDFYSGLQSQIDDSD